MSDIVTGPKFKNTFFTIFIKMVELMLTTKKKGGDLFCFKSVLLSSKAESKQWFNSGVCISRKQKTYFAYKSFFGLCIFKIFLEQTRSKGDIGDLRIFQQNWGPVNQE